MLSRKLKKSLSFEVKEVLSKREGFFELKFLNQLLKDEFSKVYDIIIMDEERILSEKGIFIRNVDDLNQYINKGLDNLKLFCEDFFHLINQMSSYLGVLGEEANYKGLYEVTIKLANLLRNIYRWTFNARNVCGVNLISNMLQYFSHYTDSMISEIKRIPKIFDTQIVDIDKRLENGEKNISVTINFELTIDEQYTEKLQFEFDALSKLTEGLLNKK